VSSSSATLHDPNPIGVAVREESLPVHARPSATLYPDVFIEVHVPILSLLSTGDMEENV